jgi:hypothetical protein
MRKKVCIHNITDIATVKNPFVMEGFVYEFTNEKILACDVDGVIMECFDVINDRVRKKFGLPETFRIQAVAKSWNMEELPEDVRLYALECMADAEVVRQYTFKKGSRKFVKELYEATIAAGGEFYFNTHCLNQAVGDVRFQQLATLSAQLGIDPKYNISVGPKKVNIPATIIIDDYIGNLNVSNANTKVLFSMFHNRNLDEGNAFRSRDYNKIVAHVKNAFAKVDVAEYEEVTVG